eukprot:5109861-Pyramimonas_sp.AAC.1
MGSRLATSRHSVLMKVACSSLLSARLSMAPRSRGRSKSSAHRLMMPAAQPRRLAARIVAAAGPQLTRSSSPWAAGRP